MATIAQSTTGYSSLIDNTAVRYDSQKMELMMSPTLAQGNSLYYRQTNFDNRDQNKKYGSGGNVA